jgi:hypothetical protein
LPWAAGNGEATLTLIQHGVIDLLDCLRENEGQGDRSDGSGTDSGAQPPQGNSFKDWSCRAGNSVANFADKIGNASGKLELTGLGIAGVGFVSAQLEITAPGLALAATGGVGNIGAGVLQFGAGLLQGAGGGGFSNSGYAALVDLH